MKIELHDDVPLEAVLSAAQNDGALALAVTVTMVVTHAAAEKITPNSVGDLIEAVVHANNGWDGLVDKVVVTATED